MVDTHTGRRPLDCILLADGFTVSPTGPKLSLDTFLSRLPSCVVHSGRVIDIRSGIADTLQVGLTILYNHMVAVMMLVILLPGWRWRCDSGGDSCAAGDQESAGCDRGSQTSHPLTHHHTPSQIRAR